MEHFNSILFHESGPANKQHTCQPTNITINTIIVNKITELLYLSFYILLRYVYSVFKNVYRHIPISREGENFVNVPCKSTIPI